MTIDPFALPHLKRINPRFPLKKLRFWFAVIAAGIAAPVFAQTNPSPPPDTLMSYDLAEIVVSDGSVFETEANTIQRVTIADISRKNATAISDLARLIPATHVQTNSRGESLIYLRNAGERQVALFFNGALLNVPWDNRMNLDVVPTNVIGGMTVSKGAPSVLYGTNVLGGAINITSRTIDYDGAVTEIGGHLGGYATSNLSFAHIRSKGGYKFTGAGGYSTRNGVPLPKVDLPHSQQSASLRSNTDREILNLFAQGSRQFDNGAEVGLSYLFIDGTYGIAPEGHLDPVESNVRFWRYPDLRNSTVVLNGSLPVGAASIVRGALWGSWFNQSINDYASQTYQALEEQQQDKDETFGVRITSNHQLGVGQLSIGVNGLQSTHKEKVLETDDNGVLQDPGAGDAEVFEQFVYSVGVEYVGPISERARYSIGGSIDGISTPVTGDKPRRGPQADYGFSGGMQYKISNQMLLRASFGRKVRFPTMRELFGVALQRFLLNPTLKPESSFVSELGLASQGEVFSGEVIGFFQRTFDTIDQENVEVDGVSLRRRINLDGSRVWGVELVGKARPAQAVTVEGHLTMMKPRGIQGDEAIFLTEKPALLGSLGVNHNHPSGFSISGEAVYTGRAYGRSEENAFIPLARSLEIDARAAYRFSLRDGTIWNEVFLRVDNLFDVQTLPQLGLPGAGRFISTGISVSL